MASGQFFVSGGTFLFRSDFIQGTARKLIKKFIKLSSDKYHSTSPDPKGNLVPSNPCPKRLLCNTQECGGGSNIKKCTVDRALPKTGTRFLDGWVEFHYFDPVTL